MTTENERERAQLERAETTEQIEQALVLVEVAARDDQGRIVQMRNLRTISDEEAWAFLDRKEAADGSPGGAAQAHP